MTDFDKLKNLLIELGVGFTEDSTPNKYGAKEIAICNDLVSSKVSGYGGFGSWYYFDEYGNFLNVYMWEM